MAQQSAFRGVIEFLDRLGIYDVVLPFLLVFTIVFAILEKTKLFGTETVAGKEYTRKNLNAITAFVIGFLVVASTKVVSIINQALANFILVLLLGICFLMLFGTFYGQTEDVFKALGRSRLWIGGAMGIVILLIFLNAIKASNGQSWLDIGLGYLGQNFSSATVGTIIFLVIIIGFIYFVTSGGKEATASKKEKEGG